MTSSGPTPAALGRSPGTSQQPSKNGGFPKRDRAGSGCAVLCERGLSAKAQSFR